MCLLAACYQVQPSHPLELIPTTSSFDTDQAWFFRPTDLRVPWEVEAYVSGTDSEMTDLALTSVTQTVE